MGIKTHRIKCHVKHYRQARGWSQEQLAGKIGVRRQAIYDIESGRYLPNTAVALRLARQFACRVEDLFVEAERTSRLPITMLEQSKSQSPRVVVARIRERLVGFPLHGQHATVDGFRSADGLLSDNRNKVKLLRPAKHLDQTVLLLGCDPAFALLSAHTLRRYAGARVHWCFASSHKSLTQAAQGNAHMAGTHLHNTGQQEANANRAARIFAGTHGRIMGFSLMEEGLMVAKNNPLGIGSAADLAQTGVRFVNREPGAALRVLLDDHLKRAAVPTHAIDGYDHQEASHSEGAQRVACGAADVALGLLAVAEALDLDFVPMAVVRCDLVIPEDLMDHETVKIALDALHSAALSAEINSLPGYDASVTGKVIARF